MCRIGLRPQIFVAPAELLDLLFRFFSPHAVALLHTARKLVHIAFDDGKVIIGQLALLFLDLAL